MPSRRALALLLVSAAALIAPASAMASLAQPAITDAAGDAQNRFGTNQAAVDILSGDITTDGSSLRFRITFGGTPALNADTQYFLRATIPAGASTAYGDQPVPLTLRVGVNGIGSISDGFVSEADGVGGPLYGVPAAVSVSGTTLVGTAPLAAVNDALATVDVPPIGTGTPLAAPFASSENTSTNLFRQPTLRAAHDTTGSGASGFTLGPD